MVFLQCEFSCESSGNASCEILHDLNCIHLALFVQCGNFYENTAAAFRQKPYHMNCTCMIFLHCAYLYGRSERKYVKTPCHINCTGMNFLQSGYVHDFLA